jgi:hypothetical protein
MVRGGEWQAVIVVVALVAAMYYLYITYIAPFQQAVVTAAAALGTTAPDKLGSLGLNPTSPENTAAMNLLETLITPEQRSAATATAAAATVVQVKALAQPNTCSVYWSRVYMGNGVYSDVPTYRGVCNA